MTSLDSLAGSGRVEKTVSARTALRTATAADHDAVDRAFGRFDLSDRDDYARFLTAQAAAFLPVEAALDRAPGIALVEDWDQRRRSDALTGDLAALGVAPPRPLAAPPLADAEAVLGALYVLEGSRLGGSLLARGVPDDFPRAFLAPAHSALWRGLLAMLENRLVTEGQRANAIAAARAVFALFEKGARDVDPLTHG